MTFVLQIQGALHMCCPIATLLHYTQGILHTFDIPYIAFKLLEAIGNMCLYSHLQKAVSSINHQTTQI